MKILFIAHRTPYPPDKGEKIRSYNFLAQLALRHTVSTVYWVDNPRDLDHASALAKVCKGKVIPVPLNSLSAKARAATALAAGKSFSEGFYYSTRFQNVVDSLIGADEPDLIYVFSSVMARYVEKLNGLPRVVDFVDVDSDKWAQLARFSRFPLSALYALERKRLSEFEIDVSRWARYSLFVSDVEADHFRKLGGQGRIVALPNGVASDVRRLPARDQSKGDQPAPAALNLKPVNLLFVGTMNYYPNSDGVLYFAREILPRIRDRFVHAEFEIVGRFPPRAVRKLEGRNGIRVHGEVADVRPYLMRADVSVAPLRMARGLQNKVLEAMAIGVPVVATSEALKGIRVSNGDEVLIGDNPETFAGNVIRLLSDMELRAHVIKRAWQRVREDHSWTIIGDRLDGLLQTSGAGVAEGAA